MDEVQIYQSVYELIEANFGKEVKHSELGEPLRQLIRRAITEERERNAKIVEGEAGFGIWTLEHEVSGTFELVNVDCKPIAAAIRKGGTQ